MSWDDSDLNASLHSTRSTRGEPSGLWSPDTTPIPVTSPPGGTTAAMAAHMEPSPLLDTPAPTLDHWDELLSDSPADSADFDAALYMPSTCVIQGSLSRASLPAASAGLTALIVVATAAVVRTGSSARVSPAVFNVVLVAAAASCLAAAALYAVFLTRWTAQVTSLVFDADVGTLIVAYRARSSETYSLGDVGVPWWEIPRSCCGCGCGSSSAHPSAAATLAVPLRGDAPPLLITPITQSPRELASDICDILRYYAQSHEPTVLEQAPAPRCPSWLCKSRASSHLGYRPII